MKKKNNSSDDAVNEVFPSVQSSERFCKRAMHGVKHTFLATLAFFAKILIFDNLIRRSFSLLVQHKEKKEIKLLLNST